jgi:imidazolonepropionase-like amidohydrolase
VESNPDGKNAMIRTLFGTCSIMLLVGCGGDTPSAGSADQPDASGVAPGAGATAYVGAAIWDGTGSALQQGKVLLVGDGRVEGIVDTAPDGAAVVDLQGRFVTPGFINAHGHVSGRWAAAEVSNIADRVRGDLALYARYGVTSVLSLGGAPTEAFAVRDAGNDPGLRHARLQVAGEVVAGNTAASAAETAQANVAVGVDWLKLRVDDNLGTGTKMPWDAVSAAMDIASAADKPVATHIYYLEDAARLLQMGTGMIAHSVRDQQVTDEFVQQMLDTGVCYVPTLVREVSTFVYATRPEWFDDPFFLEAASRAEIDRVTAPDFQANVAASPTAAGYREALEQAKLNLRVLVGSGVPVAFGTDSGPPGRFPGYFEHLEFGLMADAGMTASEILRSATSVAAACLSMDDVGTLAPGKWADFVVFTGNPLDDIANARTIERVYIAGNEVPR